MLRICIIVYPYKIVTCHNRAHEISKCRFAQTTRSISAGQKSCITVFPIGNFQKLSIQEFCDISYINKIVIIHDTI